MKIANAVNARLCCFVTPVIFLSKTNNFHLNLFQKDIETRGNPQNRKASIDECHVFLFISLTIKMFWMFLD